MVDVGIVIYVKGEEVGTLDAKWYHNKLGLGKGFAYGGPSNGFIGKYKITYKSENNEDVNRDLEIIDRDKYFEVLWLTNGVVTAKGVGFEVSEGLAVGWSHEDSK